MTIENKSWAVRYRTHLLSILLVIVDYLLMRMLCVFAIMESSTKPSNARIGRKLGHIKELRGIKQEALASEMGVSQQTAPRMAQGKQLKMLFWKRLPASLTLLQSA